MINNRYFKISKLYSTLDSDSAIGKRKGKTRQGRSGILGWGQEVGCRIKVSVGLYEKISFVQRHKRGEEIRQVDICVGESPQPQRHTMGRS